MFFLSRVKYEMLVRQASSAKFLEKAYALIDDARLQSAKVEEVNKSWLKKENDQHFPKVLYKHPYCTTEHPLSVNPLHTTRIMMELMGPEPVSPHFQSIFEFGKWYNFFFMGLIFAIAMRSHHNHAFGFTLVNMQYGFELWIYCFYYYFLKSTGMVVPNPWKELWKTYNMDSLMNSIYEVNENLAIKDRAPSIAQVDYLRIHLEYLGTKAKLLEIHMENSKLRLKKHTYERAVSILKATERFEKDNLALMLKNGVDHAMEKLDKDMKGDVMKEIRKQAFQSALIGIKKGKMTYENDPLLPRLVKYIDEFRIKAEKLTEEEQAEAFGLTKDQKNVIMGVDKKLEEAFIKAVPPIKHSKITSNVHFKSLSA